MVPCQKPCVVSQHLARGERTHQQLLCERKDGLVVTLGGGRLLPSRLSPAVLGRIQQLWDHQSILDFKA